MILEEIQIVLDEKSKPIDKYTKIPNQINQYSSNYIIKVAFEQEQTDILYIDAVFTIDGKAAIVKRLIPTTDKIQLSPSKESGIVRYYQFKQKDTSVYSDIFKIDFYVYYGAITDPTIAAFSYSIPMQKQNYMTLNESPDVIPQIVINSDTPTADNLRAIELNGINYDATIKRATIDALGGIKSTAPSTVGETYNVSVNEDGTAYVKVPQSQGTEVVANPQTSEDDAELNGIQINGENYKILGGVQFVNALPTPTQAEYNKHLLYLYEGNLEYLTEVAADEPVVTTPATLPMLVYNTSACTVGTDCYIFGGISDGKFKKGIIKFDSISQTATTLSATLPDAFAYASACAVGTDCYIFGGQGASYRNTIIKFDSISQTATTLSATLPNALAYVSACAVGTDCYIFGGQGASDHDIIIKFDSISQTATTLSATLPMGVYSTSACAVGTDCYIFGGYNGSQPQSTIIKFDSVSQTVSTLSTTLNRELSNTSACAVGTDCYILGGRGSSSYYNTIIKFDSVSQTVTTLSATLPNEMSDTSACAVGTNCYVFGGRNENSKFNSIVQVAFGVTYTYNKLQKEGK